MFVWRIALTNTCNLLYILLLYFYYVLLYYWFFSVFYCNYLIYFFRTFILFYILSFACFVFFKLSKSNIFISTYTYAGQIIKLSVISINMRYVCVRVFIASHQLVSIFYSIIYIYNLYISIIYYIFYYYITYIILFYYIICFPLNFLL